MTDLVPIKRALLSVSDKTDLVPFARSLAESGVEIISTGGTAKALRDAGLDVIGIEDVTGFPEMMDGRVKTLHPNVHGALLGRRDVRSHVDAMSEHGIVPIDLVCVNLYPFERTIQQEGVSNEEAIEQIDIGGPSMLRSASKNHDAVAVITDASQYDRLVSEMRSNDGCTTRSLRRELAAAAFTRTAEYDTAISGWMSEGGGRTLPDMLQLSLSKVQTLRYGENPHQDAAVYLDPRADGSGVVRAQVVEGKPLSYNNLLDASAALEVVADLWAGGEAAGVAAAVIKHTNPCGAAMDADATRAFERAYAGDPLAAFGGILAISATIDAPLAASVCEGKRFLEVILAPDITPDAADMLSNRWANVRLLATGELSRGRSGSLQLRSIAGGMLAQQRDEQGSNTASARASWKHVAGPEPGDALIEELAFAWTIAKHLKSNAIAITAERQLLGGGAGQVDRVSASRHAVEKAGERLAAAASPVAASDAFFPFPDGPELLIDAGVKAIVQPGGSKKDAETIALCNDRGVTCVLTGERHFRH
jgi:phosphoribosylaminoimidazolecarboxamide formyltransferase/IMP cyclohydrolase